MARLKPLDGTLLLIFWLFTWDSTYIKQCESFDGGESLGTKCVRKVG